MKINEFEKKKKKKKKKNNNNNNNSWKLFQLYKENQTRKIIK